jgi:coenzyme F420-reducing hydrogenase delta subunit
MVLVSGCHPQDCHYLTGQHWAERRMNGMPSILTRMGISPERFRVEWISAAEGRKYAKVINEMDETLKGLGGVRIRQENESVRAALEQKLARASDIVLKPLGRAEAL